VSHVDITVARRKQRRRRATHCGYWTRSCADSVVRDRRMVSDSYNRGTDGPTDTRPTSMQPHDSVTLERSSSRRPLCSRETVCRRQTQLNTTWRHRRYAKPTRRAAGRARRAWR